MGEDFAQLDLRRHDCAVVARGYRPRSGDGEIDLVAWHGGTLVFAEVKPCATDQYGAPDRYVDTEKQQNLERRNYAHRAGVE